MAWFSLLIPLFPLTLLLLSTPVSASPRCRFIIGCGEVYNETPYEMKYSITTGRGLKNPSPESGAPDLCEIWNSPGWLSNNVAETVSCKQETMPAHGHVGGRSGETKIDVDAYTFADRDYWAQGGVRTKGVWTRIHDGMNVHCRGGEDEQPKCENQ